jgi:hypothetical protein
MDDAAEARSAGATSPAPAAPAEAKVAAPPAGAAALPAATEARPEGAPPGSPSGQPAAAMAVDAGHAAPHAAAEVHPAHATGRDGGAPPAAETRHAASQTAASEKAKAASASVDGGVAASERDRKAKAASSPDGGVALRRGGEASAPRRPRDEDDGRVRVERFLDKGGADLVGRVVNVETGRPLAGISVEARLEERFVEGESDNDGTFKMPGMVPGSKVLVWIGGRRDRIVAERIDVKIPDGGAKADMGVVKLLTGDELDSHLDGWIGLYLTRKDGIVKVSAVNAWVPAYRAGIEVGDSVLSVNGRDIKGWGPRSVAFLLRGPSGSSVSLEVESGDGNRRKLTLNRVQR